MSLYNMMFGVNPLAGVLMYALKTKPAAIPRFRDCYLEEHDGKQRIVIYTRTGGGNRAYYGSPKMHFSTDPEDSYTGPWNSDLRALPGYQGDEDDSFDNTYARFYYDLPPVYERMIVALSEIVGKAVDPREKWNQLMRDIENDEQTEQTMRAMELGRQIAKHFRFGEAEEKEQ